MRLLERARKVAHAVELARRRALAAGRDELLVDALDLAGTRRQEAAEEIHRLELEVDRAAREDLDRLLLREERSERGLVAAEGSEEAHAVEEHPVIPDEVDDREARFAFGLSQTAPELLEEHDGRLRGSQHDHAVHVR